ncbi:MAG: CDP-alcohol phosphatidyltransferase family protein [Actinomycetaceae bacterium]|nr:CDP-alcohol phosphatidyltransferase family protein [Actinomycetaceae bacterium]
MSESLSWAGKVRANLARLEAAQKPANGVPAYTRWVNRRGARIVAAIGAASGVTPNGITAISFLLSLSGMLCLIFMEPSFISALLVAILLALGYLFDSADGQLARLTGTSSKAGEWLDHVVDAFRSPAIHFTLAVAIMLHRPEISWLALVALGHGLVNSGQFLSQILAEAFIKGSGGTQRRGGTMRSFVLLPTDPGTLCWSFALWGWSSGFTAVYCLLTAIAVAHSAISLRRRYSDVRALDAAAQSGTGHA